MRPRTSASGPSAWSTAEDSFSYEYDDRATRKRLAYSGSTNKSDRATAAGCATPVVPGGAIGGRGGQRVGCLFWVSRVRAEIVRGITVLCGTSRRSSTAGDGNGQARTDTGYSQRSFCADGEEDSHEVTATASRRQTRSHGRNADTPPSNPTQRRQLANNSSSQP